MSNGRPKYFDMVENNLATSQTMTRLLKPMVAIQLGLIVLVNGTLSARDWPQWLGAGRDAKATDFKAPGEWPEQLKLQWRVTIGEGVSTPALVGGRVYTFSREGGSEVVRCLDGGSGKELWSDRYDALPANGPARSFSGPRSSPAVADGKVVALGLRGVVSCYDATSGNLLWRKTDYPGALPRFFTSSSPMILEGVCFVQAGGGDQGGIVAHDLASGNEKWRWEGGGAAYASPALLKVGGASYLVAETDNRVVAVSVADGKTAWETPFAVQGRGYNAATPIVHEQTVYYAGSGRGATAVRFTSDGNGLAGAQLWKNTDNSVQFNTPIYKDGLIYGLSANNDLFCLDAGNGKTLWTAPLNPAAVSDQTQGRQGGRRRGGGRGGFGSIVDAGSVLLALTPAAELVVFQPSASAYHEVARIKVADSPTYAYPVVSGNRIIIKDQNDVLVYTVN